MEYSLRRAEEAASEIGECQEPSMEGSEPYGAYAILKRWYWHASARAPNPSRTNMDKDSGKFQTIYQKEDPNPPGMPLSAHVDPAKVND